MQSWADPPAPRLRELHFQAFHLQHDLTEITFVCGQPGLPKSLKFLPLSVLPLYLVHTEQADVHTLPVLRRLLVHSVRLVDFEPRSAPYLCLLSPL